MSAALLHASTLTIAERHARRMSEGGLCGHCWSDPVHPKWDAARMAAASTCPHCLGEGPGREAELEAAWSRIGGAAGAEARAACVGVGVVKGAKLYIDGLEFALDNIECEPLDEPPAFMPTMTHGTYKITVPLELDGDDEASLRAFIASLPKPVAPWRHWGPTKRIGTRRLAKHARRFRQFIKWIDGRHGWAMTQAMRWRS